MKTLQRTLSVLLAVCLLLCCAPLAMADNTFTEPAQAADYVRSCLLRRQENIQFVYAVPVEEIGPLNNENISARFHQLEQQFTEALFAHTGVSNEGDYLLKHLGLHGFGYQCSYSSADPRIDYQVTYKAEYHTTAAQEQQLAAAVANALKQLNLSGKNAYEKVRAINDYICDKVTYDYTNLNDDSYNLKYSAYAALINGTSVCQGYASLFYRMALEAGLDCRILSGKADNGEGIGDHAWNIVRLGGKYYYIDVTWNDGSRSDKYFLIGKDGFRDHFPSSEFTSATFTAAYPIAEKTYKEGDPLENDCGGNHTPVIDPAVAPTCTQSGLTEGSHCSVCGEVLTKRVPVPATGHRMDGGRITRPATCIEAGEQTFTCTVCQATKTEAVAIDPGNHANYGTIVKNARPATANETGYTGDTVCKGCGAVLRTGSVIPPSGSGTDVVYLPGDVDGNGKLEPSDARLALRASVKLERYEEGSAQFTAADANKDGVIGSDDARSILRAAVQLEDPADWGKETPSQPQEEEPSQPQESNTVEAFVQEVIRLVNVERAKQNLPALTENKAVTALAQKKAQEMHDLGYFDHKSPTYGQTWDMYDAAGIRWGAAGENIAMGQRTPEQVVNSWMNSKGHRENILNTDFSQIGVGYCAQDNIWVQMFLG